MLQLSAKARRTFLISAAVVAAFCCAAAVASAKSCVGGPSDSAINQYCESIPSSTGSPSSGHSSGAGAGSTLATSLPTRIVHQITGSGSSGVASSAAPGSTAVTGSTTGTRAKTAHGGASHRSAGKHRRTSASDAAARRQLLSLPAVTVRPAALHFNTASADIWAPFTWLLAILAGLALALAAAAFAVGRRRTTSD
jgi:hypothetical protein